MKKCMKKFIYNIKEFFRKNNRLSLLIVFILQLIINLSIVGFTRYDGEYFISKSQEMSLIDFSIFRYQTWTSRNLIEIVTCIILRFPKELWAFVNTLFELLIYYSILKIFVNENDKKSSLFSIAFITIYPMYKISSCGWGVGVTNYTWVMAMLFFSIISIKKIFYREPIKKYMYPLYLLALIYACNQEQACAIAFAIYGLFSLILIARDRKKVSKFILIEFLVVIFSLVFILTCPGNYIRKTEEISSYYVEYPTLSIFDKISLGLTSTVNNLIIEKNVVFFAFSVILAIYIMLKYDNILYKVIASVPLISSVTLGIGRNVTVSLFPFINEYLKIIEFSGESLMLTDCYLDFINFVPIIFSFVVFGSIALSLLLTTRLIKNNIVTFIYLLGLASRMMMGFSPTIFASSDRTFLFLEFSFIIVGILLWQEILKITQNEKILNRITIFYVILAIFQILNTWIFTLLSI